MIDSADTQFVFANAPRRRTTAPLCDQLARRLKEGWYRAYGLTLMPDCRRIREQIARGGA